MQLHHIIDLQSQSQPAETGFVPFYTRYKISALKTESEKSVSTRDLPLGSHMKRGAHTPVLSATAVRCGILRPQAISCTQLLQESKRCFSPFLNKHKKWIAFSLT